MAKYKIITTEDRKVQVIDVATGEDIASKLWKLTLYLEPQDFRLELVYSDHTPVVDIECQVEVTNLTEQCSHFKHVNPKSGLVTMLHDPRIDKTKCNG